ncbi:helix-turn-helix domain-containing protein [Saccharopolyspora sp. CA-218241]|uniref:helix-turn-helix domain-containing protein n=1 Tax=Saccharopolyspora sp. CA-218241 TaxID=3240027 RepID=UPI003D99782F
MDRDQDWKAVATAISRRMEELGLRQRDVADKADVGLSTVQELAGNWKPRRRNPKTLAAISVALGWPAGKLSAIAKGTPEDIAETLEDRVAALEDKLAEVVRRLDRK